MSNLYDLAGLRNRMLSCRKDAHIIISFCEEDEVDLIWMYDNGKTYRVTAQIHSIAINSRVFERQMHKAKRFLRFNKG